MAAVLAAGLNHAEAASSPRSISVAWDASPDADVTDYVVRYGVRSKVYSKSFRTGGRTTATLGGFQEGIGYYITVAAVNRFGLESDPSEEMQYADPCAARVLKLALVSGEGPAHSARVSFGASAGRKYRLESSVDLETWTPDWVTPVASGKSVLEFTDTRPAAGRWRFYRAVMAGPFVEAPNPLALAVVSQPVPGIKVGFTTEAGRSYELQASDNGQVWTIAWGTMAAQGGWVEHLDHNAPPSRRYRLLAAVDAVVQGASCMDSTDVAPVISDLPPAA